MMQNLNGTEGSVTIIGAVSPQGGDFSETCHPEHQAVCALLLGIGQVSVLRAAFPAIHWLTSYSEYVSDLTHVVY